MAVDNPFLILPREVRDIIYTYALQDIKFTNILLHKTAYNPENAPLLYINDVIAKDVQHLLYKDHQIVVHLVKPQQDGDASRGFASHIQQCSRLMKQRSNTLVFEMCWSGFSSFGSDHSIEKEYSMPLKDPVLSGDSRGQSLAGRFFRELAIVLPDLPNIRMIQLNAWLGLYNAFADEWKPSLQEFLDLGLGIPLRLGYARS